MQRKITRVEQSLPALPVLKRVAAYARVSTAKDAMLHSLSAQVSYYSSLIQQNPEWLFSGVYCDEGLTGTKDARPGFQQMLDDCRAGKIDMVITKSISRFARNTLILLDTVRELKSLNVDVYFEEQNIHSISGDGELMLTILASFAQEESRSVSENCKWRIRERYKQGELVSLRYLYGYRINKDGISVATDEGWLYLAGIMDLCGKELVGWAMDARMTKELVIRCFENARKKRGSPKGVILHSDRGSQYCSIQYQKMLKKYEFKCSMSRKGNCWDNAPMESFWGKLKQEWLNGQHFRTREEAKAAVFWYIEIYYHRKRLHAGNGYKTPISIAAMAA